jgi:hypothetical protein
MLKDIILLYIKMEPKRKIVLSLDIEADGPAPLVNSCTMIGIAAVFVDTDPLNCKDISEWMADSREWCIQRQPDCVEDKKCMEEFWSKLPELKKYIEYNAKPVTEVMLELSAWLRELNKKYDVETWVARPSSYDYQWINCLYHKFCPVGQGKTKRFPLPFSITCISTMYKTLQLLNYNAPDYRSDSLPHSHNALDDAKGQAYQYLRMRHDLSKMQVVPQTIDN